MPTNTGTGLGRSYDIVPIVIPIDAAASQTGDQFSLRDCAGCDIVIFTGDGAAGRNITFTVKKHVDMSDATGTTIALGSAAQLRNYFYKQGTTTAVGVGTWTKGTWFDADGAGIVVDSAEGDKSSLFVIPIEASDLGDGYSALSISAVVTANAGAKLTAVLAILRGLAVQRAPQNLADVTV